MKCGAPLRSYTMVKYISIFKNHSQKTEKNVKVKVHWLHKKPVSKTGLREMWETLRPVLFLSTDQTPTSYEWQRNKLWRRNIERIVNRNEWNSQQKKLIREYNNSSLRWMKASVSFEENILHLYCIWTPWKDLVVRMKVVEQVCTV